MNKFKHKPVLLDQVINCFEYLADQKEPIFIDGTLGLGGHSLAIASRIKAKNKKFKVIGIDKDQKALQISESKIKDQKLSEHFLFVHNSFENIKEILNDLNIDKIDGMLLDLGVSSMQLDDKSRGFSFEELDAPLDMRMDQSQNLTAKDIVNNYSAKDLERVLKDGEEWNFRKITRIILEKREEIEIKTVGDLVRIIPKNKKLKTKNHPATDTFRALRLEVNHELNGLKQAIEDIVPFLKPKSRLAIISFHSLEDRIVKQTFVKLSDPCTCPKDFPQCFCGKKAEIKIISKKPITPDEKEIANNPRSRSAKLRIINKIESTTTDFVH